MNSLRMAVLACALTIPGAVAAAQGQDAAFFKQLDANGDGGVDREEFTLEKGAILYSLDKNRSLKLEKGETKLSPEAFRRYAGKDGVIDGGEMFEMAEVQFEAFDQNGDLKISPEEFRRHVASLRVGGPQTAVGR